MYNAGWDTALYWLTGARLAVDSYIMSCLLFKERMRSDWLANSTRPMLGNIVGNKAPQDYPDVRVVFIIRSLMSFGVLVDACQSTDSVSQPRQEFRNHLHRKEAFGIPEDQPPSSAALLLPLNTIAVPV